MAHLFISLMSLGTTENTFSHQEKTAVPSPAFGLRNYRPFLIASGLLLLLFSKPLWELFRFSMKTELFSHVILIPCISFYFVWQKKTKLPHPAPNSPGLAAAFAIPGVIAASLYWIPSFSEQFSIADRLSFSTLAFVLLFYAVCVGTLGLNWMRSNIFALAFLLFFIPFPDGMTNALEIASQNASANTYGWMMDVTGVTYFRQGLVFGLPNLNIRVAQECSGIRSSVVLFIVSVIAGQMFLRSNWKRVLFTLCVIPLGIARNGFRIYALSMLTVHWDPDVINGPLHHQGGPVFFVLSLIPFFALLLFLWKTENRKGNKKLRAS
ncbi:MAG: exosortase/archaeosortase family protein [Verrucomicrobiota bacterium]